MADPAQNPHPPGSREWRDWLEQNAAATPAATTTGAPGVAKDGLPAAINHPDWKVIGDPVEATDPTTGTPILGPGGEPLLLVNLSAPSGPNRQMTVQARPDGTYTVIKGPADVPETRTPEETNENVARAVADRAKAEAAAKEADITLKKVQEDEREANFNQSQGNGYLTHEQLATSRRQAAEQNLNADQVAVQRAAMENTNKNTIVQNQIAALNASTAAATAASNARANEAQVRHIELNDSESAAKFEWQKAQDEIKQQNEVRDQQLRALQQQQTNAVQVEQNKIAAGGLEQRAAEAAQTAQTAASTAATTAAANVYGTERQAQTAAGGVGQDLLSNRATAANNLLQNILSGAANMAQSSDGIGGGLQAPLPAGFGAGLVSGIQGVTAGQFGGQDTLEAAARMVRGAQPGAEMTPQGQAAIGVLQQAFDRYGELSGAPHPQVAATTAANQSGNGQGIRTPVTAGTGTDVNARKVAVQPTVLPQVQRAPEPNERSINYNPNTPAPSGLRAPVTINIG